MKKKDVILDEFVNSINLLYEQSDCERDFKDLLILFNEDVGRCFQLINRKRSEEIEDVLPSIFKWFCALYAKYRNNKILVSDILWNKFPEICPYCKQQTCNCGVAKGVLDITHLRDAASKGRDRKPNTINDWQEHFQKIYPRGADSSFNINVNRLAEELSELSEAYRKSFIKKDIPCIEMELADVFSWIMGIANLINQLKMNKKRPEWGQYLIGEIMYNKFHDGCPNCKDLRGKHAFNSCCCSIKEQKFRLISDYEDVEDKTQNGNQEQVKIPPVIF